MRLCREASIARKMIALSVLAILYRLQTSMRSITGLIIIFLLLSRVGSSGQRSLVGTPEVQIEAAVVEVETAQLRQVAHLHGRDVSSTEAFAIVIPDVAAQNLKRSSNSRVLHSSLISTGHEETAHIRISSRALSSAEEPILNVGIDFNVTPRLTALGAVFLSLKSWLSVLADESINPVFASLPIQQEIRLTQGMTGIFGRFMSPGDTSALQQMTRLQSVPMLRSLFLQSSEQSRELIIMLTPHLASAPMVTETAAPAPILNRVEPVSSVMPVQPSVSNDLIRPVQRPVQQEGPIYSVQAGAFQSMNNGHTEGDVLISFRFIIAVQLFETLVQPGDKLFHR